MFKTLSIMRRQSDRKWFVVLGAVLIAIFGAAMVLYFAAGQLQKRYAAACAEQYRVSFGEILREVGAMTPRGGMAPDWDLYKSTLRKYTVPGSAVNYISVLYPHAAGRYRILVSNREDWGEVVQAPGEMEIPSFMDVGNVMMSRQGPAGYIFLVGFSPGILREQYRETFYVVAIGILLASMIVGLSVGGALITALIQITKLEQVVNRFAPAGEGLKSMIPPHLGTRWVVAGIAGQLNKMMEQMRSYILSLRRAVEVQLLFLIPHKAKVREFGSFEVGAFYEPSKEVSGDLLLVEPVNDSQVFIFVGDCLSKGFPSALVMAVLKGLLMGEVIRMRAQPGKADPAQVLPSVVQLMDGILKSREFSREHLSGAAAQSHEFAVNEYTVEAAVALLDVKERHIHWISCEHVPPLLRRLPKRWERIEGTHAMALGDMETPPRGMCRFQFSQGDLLLFFTDGLTESMSSDGKLFDYDGIMMFVDHNTSCSLKALGTRILNACVNHSATGVAEDDMTLVAVKLS